MTSQNRALRLEDVIRRDYLHTKCALGLSYVNPSKIKKRMRRKKENR
jgi:hypothetical protein